MECSNFPKRYTLNSCSLWLLFNPNLEELEKKIVNLMEFCKTKNLKLNPDKMVIGEEVEFGGSVISTETVREEDVVFIAPKNKRIKELKERNSGVLWNVG